MNKKLFLIVALGVVAMYASAREQVDVESAESPENTAAVREGVHPHHDVAKLTETYAHWSLQVEGGFNLIDADFSQSGNSLVPYSRIRPMGGIALQYDFTPVWGLSLGYQYANYGVKSTTNGLSNWLLYGHMHTIGLDLSYDLIDCWFPRRKHNICSFYLLAGVGLGIYSSEFRIAGTEPTSYRFPEDGSKAVTGVLSAGALLEFNLSRSVALGVKGQYKWYTTDKIDGKIQGSNNDAAEYCALSIRYKFAANKNNHTRNYASNEKMMDDLLKQNPQKKQTGVRDTVVISHKDTLVVSNVDTIYVINERGTGRGADGQYAVGQAERDNYERLQARVQRVENDINTLRQQVASGGSPSKVIELERRISQLENELASIESTGGATTGGSGNTSIGHTYQTRRLGGLINIGEDVAVYDHIGYVFFDNDRYTLNEHAQQSVLIIADKLLDNSLLYAEVVGFCDNTGSIDYNKALAKKRADAVINELINVYQISPDRILPMPIGVLTNVRQSYAPNRRVEVHFTTKKNLDEVRAEENKKNGTKSSTSTTSRPSSSTSTASSSTQWSTATPVGQTATTTRPASGTTTRPATSTTTQPASSTAASSTTTTTTRPAASSSAATTTRPAASTATQTSSTQTTRPTGSTTTAPTTVRPMTQNEIARVVVKQGYTTLVRLARRFYNCADCWVYIYEANRNVISDPNVLTDNMMLIIPNITEEQKDSTVLKEKLRQYGK